MLQVIEPRQMDLWITQGHTDDEVRQWMSAQGHGDEAIAEVLQMLKKIRQQRRLWKGFLFAGAGAFVGFLSCVLSLVNPAPELYGLFLYGFTSLAILMIVAGLYFVLE